METERRNNLMKNLDLAGCFILFILVISFSVMSYAQYVSTNAGPDDITIPFTDVPQESYAYDAIHDLRRMGITNGIGRNKFGYGRTMTRGEFVTLLVKLLECDPAVTQNGSFSDNTNLDKFYFIPVETAVRHGIITDDHDEFRPDDPITREEAVIMIVNGLGYGDLARRLHYFDKPYDDVSFNKGYITIAKDFGIISSAPVFDPSGSILREQAAAMLVRMLNATDRRIKDINGFYAISSSSQKDKIKDFSSVCFGWSRVSFNKSNKDIVLNMSNNALGFNEFYLPVGFSDRLDATKDAGVPALLMVYADQSVKVTDPVDGKEAGLLEYIIDRPEIYSKLIDDITNALTIVSRDDETGSFDGVCIDFEGLRGEHMKSGFNTFLKDLRIALDRDGKKLYVAVHPLIHPKRSSVSIDGYDYRAIGDLADKVILMAHDYDAKRLTKVEMARGVSITPLTPIEDIYYALETVTDNTTGVQDKSKIMLQISFDWTVWRRKDGKTINSKPYSYNLENFIGLLNSGREIDYNYHEVYENPCIKYMNPEDGTEDTVWYENPRSVMAKTDLAKFFGIEGISLWRLGLIPDQQNTEDESYDMGVWQYLINEIE